MSAAYGIRFQCDHCGAEQAVWKEDGDHPAIRRAVPDGWRKSLHRKIEGTDQTPLVCRGCIPVLEAWEAEDNAWQERRRTFATSGQNDWAEAWKAWWATNPRPPFPFGAKDRGPVEIRKVSNDPGKAPHLDEVVVRDAMFFHLEQMDDGHWWMEILRSNGHTVVVNLSTKRNARIRGIAEEDV